MTRLMKLGTLPGFIHIGDQASENITDEYLARNYGD